MYKSGSCDGELLTGGAARGHSLVFVLAERPPILSLMNRLALGGCWMPLFQIELRDVTFQITKSMLAANDTESDFRKGLALAALDRFNQINSDELTGSNGLASVRFAAPQVVRVGGPY